MSSRGQRFREEVINVQLANALTARGLAANAETIQSTGRPDVLIYLDGLKLVIEGRAQNRPRASLEEDAKERVLEGAADISMAIVYPEDLGIALGMAELGSKIEAASYDGVIFSFKEEGITSRSFSEARLGELVEVINNVFHLCVRNNVVQEHVKRVEHTIGKVVDQMFVTNLFSNSEALVARLKAALGIEEDGRDRKRTATDPALVRMAAFILFDAAVFHEILSGTKASVRSLRSATPPYHGFLSTEWDSILRIDYKPVFSIAREVLQALPSSPNTERLLKDVMEAALNVISSGILLKHDFMGRVYHKLLLQTAAHFYATYYTSIPAAWLLANLVLKTPNPCWPFSTLEDIEKFRLLDPACGSGTLLSASYMAIKDLYVLSRPLRLDLRKLHRALVERVIHGWDVLDYATHLTLTTLALHSNRSTVNKSNIFTLPAGISTSGIHLGSLDYLRELPRLVGRGFTGQATRKSLRRSTAHVIRPPECDAVLMNPPYSRSAKPNIKFGYTIPKVRSLMSKELVRISKGVGATGIGQAGLGAYFMLLALKLAKERGRIGVVIPRAMLSGVSWREVRERYLNSCEVEYIVSNYDPGNRAEGIEAWCWSENTNLGEVLIVARKCRKPAKKARVLYVNLRNKPRNEVEALLLAQQAIRARSALSRNLLKDEWRELRQDKLAVGYAYKVRQSELKRNWLAPCVFAHPQLNAFVLRCLANEHNVLLRELVTRTGADIKQVKGNFAPSQSPTTFRLVWGHQAAMNTLLLKAEHIRHGLPKQGPATERFYQQNASSLIIAERPHLSTECLLAMETPIPVLTTAFWEVRLIHDTWLPCLLLWVNSTYGFLAFLANATSSMGDIFKMKKEQLLGMPVVNPTRIPVPECLALVKEIQNEPFLPYAQEFSLASEKRGARYRIDHFFSARLELPALGQGCYALLANDPVVAKPRKGAAHGAGKRDTCE